MRDKPQLLLLLLVCAPAVHAFLTPQAAFPTPSMIFPFSGTLRMAKGMLPRAPRVTSRVSNRPAASRHATTADMSQPPATFRAIRVVLREREQESASGGCVTKHTHPQTHTHKQTRADTFSQAQRQTQLQYKWICAICEDRCISIFEMYCEYKQQH